MEHSTHTHKAHTSQAEVSEMSRRRKSACEEQTEATVKSRQRPQSWPVRQEKVADGRDCRGRRLAELWLRRAEPRTCGMAGWLRRWSGAAERMKSSETGAEAAPLLRSLCYTKWSQKIYERGKDRIEARRIAAAIHLRTTIDWIGGKG